MTSFSKASSRSILGLLLLLALVWPAMVRAQGMPGDDLASADALKSKAFEALKAGKFKLTSDYLARAAELSKDPAVERMAGWTQQFEQQQQVFTGERRKEYEKAVADVHLLLDHEKPIYAMDIAARAYLLADDKKAFHDEPWVRQLVTDSTQSAARYEGEEQWIKALRLYSSLGSIEPANPQWKEQLKAVTRRIRLLAVYAPDELKAIQDSESKEREAVDALLKPATRPTTHPAAREDEERDPSLRTDWRDTLKGIKKDMLWDALMDARVNYYREVSYKQMGIGGLKGVRAVATTKGLERTFPKLADGAVRDRFLRAIDAALADVSAAAPKEERDKLEEALSAMYTANTQTLGLPEAVLVNEFADGAFAELDPFSNIIWPYDLEEFQKTTQGEFSGVGIQIQSDEEGNLKVASPLEDSPALKAGIREGDIISHIEGKSAKGISLNQAVKRITGERGTQVRLTIRTPKGVVRDLVLTRDTIKVASIKGWLHRPGGGWDYFIDPDQKIAYIRLTNFTKTTSDDLGKAMDEMRKEGARGVILDLRYNPGGLLTAATEVADKFLSVPRDAKDAFIVSTRADRDNTPNQATATPVTPDEQKEKLHLPMVVLINQYSASASEIVSGALKDYKRAMLVGDRTFGKGSVQMLFALDRKQAYLKLTTSHYYLPSGRCIHREENSQEWGVDPDVVIDMTPEQMRSAIDARQEYDVLRDAAPVAVQPPPTTGESGAQATKKDPLTSDAQLAGALLLMRLQLAGAQL